MSALRTIHVGINAYVRSQLSYCLNDVIDIWWTVEKVRDPMYRVTLVDAKATRENIVRAAFDTLNQSEAGDAIFVSMSGHGTRVKALQPSAEPDGLDECFCPWDSITPEGLDTDKLLRDDDYGAWLKACADCQVRVTSLFDFCHSGDPHRNVATTDRCAPGDTGTGPLRRFGVMPGRTVTAAPRGVNFLDQQHITLCACRADQTAAELVIEYGRGNGAMTWAAWKGLCAVGQDARWGDYVGEIRSRLDGLGLLDQQEPQLWISEERFGEKVLPV